MKSLSKVTLVVMVIGLALAASGVRADEPSAKEQVWEGTLTVRPGVELRLVLHLKEGDGGGLKATLDSPDQGASGLRVDTVTRDKAKLAFEMEALAAKFEGTLNAGGTEAVGSWSQGGASLPFTLAKLDKAKPKPKIVGTQLWEGKLPVGPGLQYRLVLIVEKTDAGTLVAKLDSPDEGFKGLKVDPITLDKNKLVFELKISAAKYEGTLNADGTEAAGHWVQRGGRIPLTFKKTDKATEVRRPQLPKPPFPYKVESVSYPNKAGGVTLAGTMTEPEGKGPFPAVLLISGSGAQDRDETIFQHKPFLVLADSLTRRGVAVLRVDDRGVGGSSGSVSKSTSDDFAGDVLAGIAFLKSRPEIDAKAIGLIGHSEGGVIAPMVAARSDDVAFIVLMAGTGLPGDQIIVMQARLISRALGVAEKDIEPRMKVQARLLEIAKTETDDATALAKMREAVKGLKDSFTEAERKTTDDVDAAIDTQLKALRSPWFRYFLTYDPRPALAKVKCPVFALVGEKDLQVPPKENLAEIEKALKSAGNSRVTVRELPGLNHLFQTCKTGSTTEYAEIEETIAPSALAVIGDWVAEQVK